MTTRGVVAFLAVLLTAVIFAQVQADSQRILVQSTTSTQNSGFYDYILPIFQDETGLNVDVVAVGTGQAIRNAANGDADVLLVHAKQSELDFVTAGHGIARSDLMFNDYVVVGPKADPAGIAGASGISEALNRISLAKATFASRGDDSGTHKKEVQLWEISDRQPRSGLVWYRETGSGMGATLRAAVEMQAYTLSDRATWISYQDKQSHKILFEGDKALFNQYGIITVNPAKHPHVNASGAAVFVNWLLSEAGQGHIAEFRLNGQQLFFPNAK